MLKYLKSLRGKWKTWKFWKNIGEPLYRDFIPSDSYLKYKAYELFGGRKVLNAGCGRQVFKAPNVTNIDLFRGPGVDKLVDLSKPLPFDDNSFDFIFANHVMEHVPNWWNCFKEFARILKPGGTIELWFPPVSSDTIFTYRDHINPLGLESFVGTKTLKRAGTNLWAKNEIESLYEVQKLHVVEKKTRPALIWWVFFSPDWVLQFCTNYLRNCVSEEGYFFKKDKSRDS